MCLGIPGEVIEIREADLAMGRVRFAGIVKEICLAFVPEAKVGDYVIVHAGFAISLLDPEAAAQVFSTLDEAARSPAEEP
ncbi:MAG: HypC/HybG/HupF family hydrogenase formation chaperone [Byssovorax sp.]